MDVDDYFNKNKIKDQVKKIEEKKGFFIYSNFTTVNKIKKKSYLRMKSLLPEGKISQRLLDDYFLGISTVMLKRSIFKKYKFNEKYNIIGDFDLFIKLSLRYKFLSVQKSHLIYNIHGDNLSIKKIDSYVTELQNWINNNKRVLPNNLNLNNLKFYLIKLKIKKMLKNIFT